GPTADAPCPLRLLPQVSPVLVGNRHVACVVPHPDQHPAACQDIWTNVRRRISCRSDSMVDAAHLLTTTQRTAGAAGALGARMGAEITGIGLVGPGIMGGPMAA